MGDRPQRTNTYTTDPVSDRYRECLFEWNDLYDFDWNEQRSTLSFGVDDVLEDWYGFDHNERVTLEVRVTRNGVATTVDWNSSTMGMCITFAGNCQETR